MSEKFQSGLKRFQNISRLLILALIVSALIGCSSGGDGGFFLFQQSSTSTTGKIHVGDAELTCADEGNMVACRGIKYAEALRFAPSEMVELEGDINARQFGSACVQYADHDGNPLTPEIVVGSEDCLFLNVFFPAGTTSADNLPVMLWIHGGALIQGAGSVPGYDVPALVNEGVIVVTINYRLNAFGFLPHPALEDPTGNFGLKDQVKALEWVQSYIADFGGDPGNVTIFGESAGGHSVLSLMVSSIRNEGLFHKAIVQSGSYSPDQMRLTPTDLSDTTTWELPNGHFFLGFPFANVFTAPSPGPCGGTDDAVEIRTCLRNLTPEQVMFWQTRPDLEEGDPNPSHAWAWITPVYHENTFLPKSIDQALTDGDVAENVPVIIGSNLNEGSLFTGLFMPRYGGFEAIENLEDGVTDLLLADPREYDRNFLAAFYTAEAEDLYGDNANKYRNAHSMVFTDATFTCNNLNQWSQLANAGNTVYAYWFTDRNAPINPTYGALGALSAFFNLGNWGLGASHSFEIQYTRKPS